MKARTVAVIVTFNRKKLLEEGIRALMHQAVPCDLLIIDNASTDGTGEMVAAIKEELEGEEAAPAKAVLENAPEGAGAELNKRSAANAGGVRRGEASASKKRNNPGEIIYRLMDENLGGAGGFSIGVKLAYQAGYEFIWLMDDDCIVNDTSLSELFNAHEKLGGNYGFLCSKVLWCDGSICKTNVQRYPMAKRVTDFESELVRVNYATFVSMFFKREVVKKVGIPIKDFFIWSDDLEYTQRVSRTGASYLCNRSTVVHKTNGNQGINIAIEAPERYSRFKHIYRNDVYVFRAEGLKGWAYLFFRMLYHFYKILRYSPDNKLGKIKTVIKGNIDGIFFHPKVEYVD